jgi:hypothetical protein
VPVAIAQPTPLPAPAGPVERLSTAAGELVGRDLDGLADGQLQADLKTLEQVRRRVEAHQIALANALKTRQAARLADRGMEAGKAARQAERATREELTNQLQWTPSDANRATRIGGELTAAGTSSQAREQFNSGELSPRHAKLLADTLKHLTGDERDRAERLLLEAAGREDAVTFGATCRRLLAQLDHDAAMDRGAAPPRPPFGPHVEDRRRDARPVRPVLRAGCRDRGHRHPRLPTARPARHQPHP